MELSRSEIDQRVAELLGARRSFRPRAKSTRPTVRRPEAASALPAPLATKPKNHCAMKPQAPSTRKTTASSSAIAGRDQPRVETHHRADHPRNGRDPPRMRPGSRRDGRRRDRRAWLGRRCVPAPQAPTTKRFVQKPIRSTKASSAMTSPTYRAASCPDVPGRSDLRAVTGYRRP